MSCPNRNTIYVYLINAGDANFKFIFLCVVFSAKNELRAVEWCVHITGVRSDFSLSYLLTCTIFSRQLEAT